MTRLCRDCGRRLPSIMHGQRRARRIGRCLPCIVATRKRAHSRQIGDDVVSDLMIDQALDLQSLRTGLRSGRNRFPWSDDR